MELVQLNLHLLPGDDNDDISSAQSTDSAVEEDGSPILDEQDLEENDLKVEEADQIVWDGTKDGEK
jgi:hypothetical protein